MPLLVNSSPKAAGMLELGGSYAGAYLLRRGLFMPWELEGLMDRDTVANGLHRLQPLHAVKRAISEDPQLPFSRVAAMEASLYMRNQLLRDTDWTSMAHSLEVRVPLVDVTLLRTMAAATKSAIVRGGAHPKAILANAPSKPLPEYIADRAKTGFTTPIADWLQPRAKSDLPSIGSPLRNLTAHWSRRWAQQLAC
jgi:asparagine synthase (glutamine-hydrolysing)